MVTVTKLNYYELLEVSTTATKAEIKTAYRKQARKYHPDLAGNSEETIRRFKEITTAYETLCDETKRKRYDILRGIYNFNNTDKVNQKTTRTQADKAYQETKNNEKGLKKQKQATKSNFADTLNEILDGFKTGKKQSKKETPKDGSDITVEISVTLPEAVHGISKTVNILTTEICAVCKGRKFVNTGECNNCKGKGETSTLKKITVKIPPKVKHGSKIRIKNEGNKGLFGGKSGDLYLNVNVESNQQFTYDGLNVLCSIPITPYEAVLGTSISIPMADGNVSMKIMPNTSSGQKYRISAQGLKKDGKVGDIIVTVNIEVPKELSNEEIRLYEKLKELAQQKDK